MDDDSDDLTDDYFKQLGERFHVLYKLLSGSRPIRFRFTKSQQEEFGSFFDETQRIYAAWYGLDIIASVRRLGLVTFRIAMILSAIRMLDTEQITNPLICIDDDFHSAVEMAKVLMKHTVKVFKTLPTLDGNTGMTNVKYGMEMLRQFYTLLPEGEFGSKEYESAMRKCNISLPTVKRYLQKLCSTGQLIHLSHGKYTKPDNDKNPSANT